MTTPAAKRPGPDSIFWRVNADPLVLLAGGRALLMQLAHPAVARGVADHSDFRQRPLRRLRRTLDLTSRLAFAPPQRQSEAADAIRRAHSGVRGPGYSALDPDLQLWVHATLIDSSLAAQRAFNRPLSDDDEETYYQQSISLGPVLGIPRSVYPTDFTGFVRYVEQMLDLTAKPTAEALALCPHVLRPVRGVPRALFEPLTQITSGLLPDQLREAYGLAEPGPWFRWARSTAPALRRLVPSSMWELPEARRGRHSHAAWEVDARL